MIWLRRRRRESFPYREAAVLSWREWFAAISWTRPSPKTVVIVRMDCTQDETRLFKAAPALLRALRRSQNSLRWARAQLGPDADLERTIDYAERAIGMAGGAK